MKKILALILVLCLAGSIAACAEVTRITIEDPARIMVEKAGGSLAVTLTDAKTVERVTNVVCQLPLQAAEAAGDVWTYRITWQDADGNEITEITIAGSQIRWEGCSYDLSVGVDVSVLTDILETLPAKK